jgi:hypothetical protein
LEVIDNQPKNGVKKRFGVCTKQYTLPNRESAMMFLEWIEMIKILGAEKMYFYVANVHPDVMKVAKYYESTGFVDIKMFYDPSPYNFPDYTKSCVQMEYVTTNDCFYRNRNLYDYIVIIDIDEIPIPLMGNDRTWQDLLNRVEEYEKYDSISVRSVTYSPKEVETFPGVPKYHYVLNHVRVGLILLFKVFPNAFD